jgi:D-alanyl-D-alanine carboxypeptidase
VDDARARERGSVLPLVALLVVAMGGLGLVLGRLGGEAAAAGRARTAADAAALAGAAEGDGAARAVARANGAELERAERDGDGFVVRVRLAGEVATARAEGVQAPGGTGLSRGGLVPELVAALARAETLLGAPVPVTSGYRSPAAQRALWAARSANPYPVARPGTSAHEQGRAVDVSRAAAERLAVVGPAAGLCRPLPRTDPVHFELCRPSAEGP